MKRINNSPVSLVHLLVLAAITGIVSPVSAVQQITPLAAYAENSYAGREPVYAINGTGLSGENHGIVPDNTMWMGLNSSSFAKWFITDLGATHFLHSIKIWNHNQSGYMDRGVKVIDIYVSTVPSPTQPPNFTDMGTWTLIKANHTVAPASGLATYTGDTTLVLPTPVDARWVGFDIKSIQTASFGYGGIAEIKFFEATGPVVQLNSLTDLTATTADFSGTLIKDNGLSTHVLACVGETDGGRVSPDNWNTAIDLGVKSLGAFQGALSGLTADRGYNLVLCATNGVDIPSWSSTALKFITGAVSVEGTGNVYESVPVPSSITFSRPISTTNVALAVTYTVGGTAVAGQDFQALSGEFTFGVGESSYQVPFFTIDNGVADGTRTVSVSVNAGNYLTNSTSTASFSILDDESLAKVVTWTGAGAGMNWNDPANWNLGVPLPIDTAVFTDAGLSANATIALGASQTIRKLSIATTTAFTIGTSFDKTNATPNKLTLTELERMDVAGTEGLHIFGTVVLLSPNSSGDSLWIVNGSSELRLTASLSGAIAGVSLIKSGTATLALNDDTAYTGTTTVLEGAINRPAFNDFNNNLRGNLIVGSPNGTVPASYTAANGGRPQNTTVYSNGTYYQGDWPASGWLTIIGGIVNTSWADINGDIKMTAGSLNGGPITGSHMNLYTYASPLTAKITGDYQLSASGDNDRSFIVEDGDAPIDLLVSGKITNGHATRPVIKKGAGVMRLTGSSNLFSEKNFTINAGTVLVDNTSGSGTGKATVPISGGATLGGTGFIGGVSGYTFANVSAAGSSGNNAVIAPGTMDTTTGTHIIGTLSVGSASQANNVTFGAYSTLKVNIGATGNGDCLDVNGTISLAGATDTLDLTIDENAKSGVYVLARATEGISGIFDNLSDPFIVRHLTYTATTIEYSVIAPTVILIR